MNDRSRRIIEERAELVKLRRERPNITPAELAQRFPFLIGARYMRRFGLSRGGRL